MSTGRVLTRLARIAALAGGGVVAALAALTVANVLGRALIDVGLGPVPGAYELVEIGAALAVFSFLPYRQLTSGHISVDLLKPALPARVDAGLGAFHNLVMAGVAGVLVYRLTLGMLDKMAFGDTTWILQIPLWWAYAACLPFGALFVAAALYTSVDRARAALAPARTGEAAAR